MARKNADTNSDSRSERAVALMLTLMPKSFFCRRPSSSEKLADVISNRGYDRNICEQDHPNGRRSAFAPLGACGRIHSLTLEHQRGREIDQARCRKSHGGADQARC